MSYNLKLPYGGYGRERVKIDTCAQVTAITESTYVVIIKFWQLISTKKLWSSISCPRYSDPNSHCEKQILYLKKFIVQNHQSNIFTCN